MSYHGDIRLGDTIDVKFTSRQFSTGAPFTLAGSPVISAYVGNGTTEITAGITLTVDFDARTGLNNVRVVASSGNGFATATNVQLVITTGTVNAVSVVGEVVGEFSIEARSALMPTTAARTLVVDAAGLADANVVKLGPTASGTAQTARDIGASVLLSSGTGTGQVKLSSGYVAPNWGDVGNPTTVLGLTNTTVGVVTLTNTLTTYTGNTPQTGDVFPLASTEIADIKAKTDNLPSDPADASDVAAAFATVNSTLATIASYIDTEVAAIKTKTDFLPSATAGSAGGLLIAGSNAATTFATLTVTGAALFDSFTITNLMSINGVANAAQTGDSYARVIHATYGLPALQTQGAAIKTKTDSLTFTVAGQLDCNVQYVNDVQVDGVGTAGDPWGPV